MDLEPALRIARRFVEQDTRAHQRTLALMALALAGYLRDDATEIERWLTDELVEGPPFVTPYSYMVADRVRGLLTAAVGRHDDAARFFERAYRLCSEQGNGPGLAWTCYDYGGYLIDRGADRGADLVSEGQRLVTKLGMTTLQKRFASLARRVTPSVPYGLTKRETEIVGLVAEGRTNQEIANQLFVSYHTVVSHIRHIFEKTGVKNRVELVAHRGHLRSKA